MKTDELIDALIADLKPVHRLRPPAVRLLGWLMLSIPATAIAVAAMGLRPDITAKAADPVFMAEQLASFITALVAGWAALVAGVPGEPRWKRRAPVLPLAVWMASLGHQCWSEWWSLGLSGMEFHDDFICVPSIAVISAIPALAIVYAIRRGASLHSWSAISWGSLAAAALANTGLRLFHTEDAALMVIVWQFGSVLLLMAIAMLLRSYLVPPGMTRRLHSAL